MASLDNFQTIIDNLIRAGRDNDIDELQCLLIECKEMNLDAYNSIKNIEYIAENTASCGSVECLQALLEEEFNMDIASGIAAEGGHVECLELLTEYGIELDPWCWLHAVSGKHQMGTWETIGGGHINVLKFLHENDCDRLSVNDQSMVITEAIGGGHIECLKFLINECEFAWGDENLEHINILKNI